MFTFMEAQDILPACVVQGLLRLNFDNDTLTWNIDSCEDNITLKLQWKKVYKV